MLLEQLRLHFGQRDVAVGVDQALQIRSMRIELGALRLTLLPCRALSGFPRPARPDDRRRDADPEPIGRMAGRQPRLVRKSPTWAERDAGRGESSRFWLPQGQAGLDVRLVTGQEPEKRLSILTVVALSVARQER